MRDLVAPHLYPCGPRRLDQAVDAKRVRVRVRVRVFVFVFVFMFVFVCVRVRACVCARVLFITDSSEK